MIKRLRYRKWKKIIENSGLFDVKYYLFTYPDVRIKDIDPVMHYIKYGWKEGRNPNKDFDTAFYLNTYRDIDEESINPLVHYIKYGQYENRKSHPEFLNPLLKNKYSSKYSQLPLTNAQSATDLKIAVIVHAFYLDVLEDIISMIDNIEPQPMLFISVAADVNIDEVSNFLSIRGYQAFKIASVKNRGRDVAPFLVEFSEELKSYDVCCKIHGKKSLYAGSEQSNWRNHLYHNLLGSKEIVRDITNAFKENKALGIVYSDSLDLLPYWGYTWLTNKHLISFALEKIKMPFIANIANYTYFDYPAGNMFWFRPNAIKQILDAEFLLHDFPEEPIPNDGTLAHLIERLFCFVSIANGFDYIELNYKINEYRKNSSHKNFNQLNFKRLNNLKLLINNSEAIVFDIFDTLVTRTIFFPDNIFHIIEHKVDKTFGIKSNFFMVRKQCESILRGKLKKNQDVAYKAIYDYMQKSAKYSGEVIEYLRESEFAFELQVIKAKKEIKEVFDFAFKNKKNIFCVSDMYLHTNQIKNILDSCEIDSKMIKFFVSSETGYRKDNATVWKHLLENKILDPKNTLIIGDNEVSDVKIPVDIGFKNVYHLFSERTGFYESSLGKIMNQRFGGISDKKLTLLGPVINLLFANPNTYEFIPEYRKKLTPYEFGVAVMGPIMYVFMSHLYQKHKDKRLFFLARDGYFLHQLFDYYVKSKKLPLKKTTHYLLVSRRAILGAIHKNKDNIKHMIMDLGPFKGLFSQLIFNRIGLEKDFLAECNINDFLINSHKDLLLAYETVLPYLDIINKHTKDERVAYLEYLDSLQFFDDREDVLVDLGYSGTIQKYIYELSSEKLIGEYLLTTDKVKDIEHESNAFHGFFGDKINIMNDDHSNILYNYALVLEAYFTSSDGQLLHFEKASKESKSLPVYKTGNNSIETQKVITQGIKDYFDDLSLLDYDFLETNDEETKKLAVFMFEYVLSNRIIDDNLKNMLFIEADFNGEKQLDILEILAQRGL